MPRLLTRPIVPAMILIAVLFVGITGYVVGAAGDENTIDIAVGTCLDYDAGYGRYSVAEAYAGVSGDNIGYGKGIATDRSGGAMDLHVYFRMEVNDVDLVINETYNVPVNGKIEVLDSSDALAWKTEFRTLIYYYDSFNMRVDDALAYAVAYEGEWCPTSTLP